MPIRRKSKRPGATWPHPDGIRPLAAAILLQACLDAQGGSRDAYEWLRSDPWAGALCDAAELSEEGRQRACELALWRLRAAERRVAGGQRPAALRMAWPQ